MHLGNIIAGKNLRIEYDAAPRESQQAQPLDVFSAWNVF
jgi:hypothetical protein